MAVITGLNVSAFTAGGAYVDDLENATLSIDNDSEETAAVKDSWSSELTLQYGWRVEASIYAATTAPLMVLAAGSAPSAALTFTYGTKKYTGAALLRVGHSLGKGVQRHKLVLIGNGPLTHTTA